MNGQEKYPGNVAAKPTTKAGRPAADSASQGRGPRGKWASKARTGENWARVTRALDRVRPAERLRKKERFTDFSTTSRSIRSRRRMRFNAKPPPDYEANLEPRLSDLHTNVHGGAYR